MDFDDIFKEECLCVLWTNEFRTRVILMMLLLSQCSHIFTQRKSLESSVVGLLLVESLKEELLLCILRSPLNSSLWLVYLC